MDQLSERRLSSRANEIIDVIVAKVGEMHLSKKGAKPLLQVYLLRHR